MDEQERVEECEKVIEKNLGKSREDLIDSFMAAAEGSIAPVDALLPAKLQEEKMRMNFKNVLSTVSVRIGSGVMELLESLTELGKLDPKFPAVTIIQKLKNGVDTALHGDPQAETLTRKLQEGAQLAELLGFSESTLEGLYQAAKNSYDRQRYEEAADAFFALSLFNNQYYAFWIGLGNCEYFIPKYEAALAAYAMAAVAAPHDPNPHLFSARCYEALRDKDNLIFSLNLAMDLMGDRVEYKELKERALAKRAQHEKK